MRGPNLPTLERRYRAEGESNSIWGLTARAFQPQRSSSRQPRTAANWFRHGMDERFWGKAPWMRVGDRQKERSSSPVKEINCSYVVIVSRRPDEDVPVYFRNCLAKVVIRSRLRVRNHK